MRSSSNVLYLLFQTGLESVDWPEVSDHVYKQSKNRSKRRCVYLRDPFLSSDGRYLSILAIPFTALPKS